VHFLPRLGSRLASSDYDYKLGAVLPELEPKAVNVFLVGPTKGFSYSYCLLIAEMGHGTILFE
jgi:hypothetical protein